MKKAPRYFKRLTGYDCYVCEDYYNGDDQEGTRAVILIRYDTMGFTSIRLSRSLLEASLTSPGIQYILCKRIERAVERTRSTAARISIRKS